MLTACVQQAIILSVSATFLDGGFLAQICWFGFLGFWTGVLLILRNRRSKPAQTDLALVHFGYLLICTTAFFVSSLV